MLRSDNAGILNITYNAYIGCYHSASTIASVIKLSRQSGVHVQRYSFSEPQAGKSAADRMAAFMKRRVRDYIDKGNDATNSRELYKAMVDGPPLKGISVHLSALENPSSPKTLPQIAGIKSLFDFEYSSNGDITAWKYYGIDHKVLLSTLFRDWIGN